MTLLNATVTPDFAVISADTATSDLTYSARPGRVSFFISKIVAFPHLGLVTSGTGPYRLLHAWCQILSGRLQVAGVEEVNAAAPAILSSLAVRLGVTDDAHILVVGCAKERRAVLGYLYSNREGFLPVPLGGGHLIAPAVATDQPDYEDIAARWEPAARGEGVEAFHRAVAWNQFRLCAAGEGRPGAVIGGQLHIARIDRDGIAVNVAAEFPGYPEQLAEIKPRSDEFVAEYLASL